MPRYVPNRSALPCAMLDLSGMPRLEALKTVLSLMDAGAIMIPR